jgi:hypothetical protein
MEVNKIVYSILWYITNLINIGIDIADWILTTEFNFSSYRPSLLIYMKHKSTALNGIN